MEKTSLNYLKNSPDTSADVVFFIQDVLQDYQLYQVFTLPN